VVVVASTCCWFLTKYNVNLAVLNIMVDFFQVISLFVHANVPWPSMVREVISLMSALNFNIEILGIDCAIEFLYSEKFAMKMLLPLIILVAVLTVYVLTWIVSTTAEKCNVQAGRLKNLARFDDACIGAYIIIFYFVYLELARTALDVFNCEERVPSDGHS
jgi:hypothetical protein